MKTNLKTLLTLWMVMYSSCSIFAQNVWTQRNPKPGSYNYNLVHMTNTQKGVIFSGQYPEKMAVTINGGDYWSYQPSGFSSWISDMDFLTPTKGLIAMAYDSVKKTTDGGLTWKKFGNGYGLTEMVFADSINGFAKTFASSPPVANRYLRTQNGGLTWTQTATGTNDISRLAYRTSNEIWGIKLAFLTDDSKKLWKTQNNGQSWTPVDIGALKQVLSVFFLDQNLGWASGDSGMVAKTTNGGQTWQVEYEPSGLGGIFEKIQFASPTHGWAVRQNAQIIYTNDGGTTWSSAPWASEQIYTDYYFLNQSEGWAIGLYGLISKTTDGGQTWQKQTEGPVNTFNGGTLIGGRTWLVGNSGLFVKSDDKGFTWQEGALPNGFNAGHFSDIQFVNGNTGYAASTGGILKTNDGGELWHSVSTPFSSQLDLQFLSPDTGFFTDMFGGLYRTNDGGANWMTLLSTNISTFTMLAVHKISMVNSQVGFRITSLPVNVNNGSASVFKTVDGGVTWSDVTPNPFWRNAVDMHFINAQTGWVLYNNFGSGNSLIGKTTDGGQTWQDISNSDASMDIHFINPLVGYKAGYSLFKSTDGGITWSEISQSSPTGFRGIVMQNDNAVALYGVGGTIYTSNAWTGADAYVVSGKIVKKENNDCIPDLNEAALPYKIVKAEPGPYFGSTRADGKYAIRLEPGSYQVSQVQSSPVMSQLETQYCPTGNNSIGVQVNGLLDTIGNNHFINTVKSCPILVINQTHNLLRPCRISQLYISVQNQGNLASDSEFVHLKFPPQLHFLSTNVFYDYNAVDSTYRFTIKPLQPFEAISISITDSVDCNPGQLTGQMLCVKATIPDAPNCLFQAANWDGVNLEVASKCLGTGQTRFTIRNSGASMASTSQYQIFIDSLLVYHAPFQLASNSSMTITLPPGAPSGFVRLVVPQSAHHPLSTFASAEANCATGLSTNGIFPPPDESPLVDIECVIVTNSVDPNDKAVFPIGWGTAGNVEPETEFKYTVRFQNTGTDTAFKVVLVDTLDANLDIATLQIGSSSHLFDFKVSGKGRPVLSWTFNTILLPDSYTNEAESHGYVSYSIRPKTGLPLGTRLENFADIYFDFNDPVRTNTTVNTLWRPTLVDGILDTVFTVTANRVALSSIQVSIYPNPSKGKLVVDAPQNGTVNLYSVQGHLVLVKPIHSGQNLLNLYSLPRGLYMAKFFLGDSQVFKKIILE